MYVCGVCSIGMEGMQREVSLRLLKYGLELRTPYTFQSCKEDHNENSRLDTHACSMASTTHVNHPSIHPVGYADRPGVSGRYIILMAGKLTSLV